MDEKFSITKEPLAWEGYGYLNTMMAQVKTTSNSLVVDTQQVSSSSQNLSQGACEQAASLEQITAALNTIQKETKLNADRAATANQLADGARDAAENGNGQMKEMVEAMRGIEDSSQKISRIIKVIDEIAFQTNLLALNAAVEAARAGIHGKGFAVVAEEVRNLAARSANAAKETTELIQSSVNKVEEGTLKANKTANALEEIVELITKVTDLINEISAASSEQAVGITQTNDVLVQVDQVTQQNTANSEESATAADSLAIQSVKLQDLVNKFKLNYSEEVDIPKPTSVSSITEDFGTIPTANIQSDIDPEKVIPFNDLDDTGTGRY